MIYSEDSEDDEVEDFDKGKLVAMGKAKPGRTSVSAEVYGSFNKKGSFKPQTVPKTVDQEKRIRLRLGQAFMFQCLDEEELRIVIGAMEEKKFKSGDSVITQGSDGDHLYVVDQGELDCFKVFKKGEEAKYLKTYKPGESFGELALLYNAPRAATIKSKTASILFSLDRQTFNNIVKDAANKKREYYADFLGKVEILADMDPYEKLQISDALKSVKFNKGDFIIKQGEQDLKFYLLQKGQCIATKNGNPNEVVFKYKSGDYFGELSLINSAPRAANIIAQTDDTVAVFLDSASFRRLIGPLEDILKRNTAKYAKFIKA